MNSPRARNNPARQLRMQAAMQIEPQSYDALAAVGGLSKQAVGHWIKTLRSLTPSPVRIAGWSQDARGRMFVPLWAWEAGADVPRPGQSRTPAERMATLRAQRKGGAT